MSADLRPERCGTCAYWSQGPAIAAAVRRPAGSDENLGCCHRDPPTHWGNHFPVSVFPEVHAHRFCGDWMPAGEPDGDGREGVPVDNVVQLRGAA